MIISKILPHPLPRLGCLKYKYPSADEYGLILKSKMSFRGF